ncbi:MAG: hypothetical protein HON23_00265 [Rickettsiales bacterium]|jgi:hypothetical protein|nr:hypothetical protein [Rickettsiales bacterium]
MDITTKNTSSQHTQANINMIDTLKYCKEFQAAGFNEQQAELLTSKLRDTTEYTVKIIKDEELATKTDLKNLDHNLSLKIERVRSNLLQWMISMFFAQTTVVFAMLKFLN